VFRYFLECDTCSLISSAVKEFQPYYTEEFWKYNHVPDEHWRDTSNLRRFLDYLSKELNIKVNNTSSLFNSHHRMNNQELDDWYKVNPALVKDKGGLWPLSHIFNNSMHKMLSTAYPEHHWHKWKFQIFFSSKTRTAEEVFVKNSEKSEVLPLDEETV
jgi:hypothetical protein